MGRHNARPKNKILLPCYVATCPRERKHGDWHKLQIRREQHQPVKPQTFITERRSENVSRKMNKYRFPQQNSLGKKKA